MKIIIFLQCLLSIWSSLVFDGGQSFSTNHKPNGPRLRPRVWPFVKPRFPPGTVQSPMDVETANATPMCLRPINFHRLWKQPKQEVTIENTGSYLEVLMNEPEEETPYVSGGPLFKDKYYFVQMHFHWGPTDQCGSEHRVNKKCYATELHMVMYNDKYGSFEKAVHHTDGVTVIALMGEVSEEDNPAFDELVEKTADIIKPESKTRGEFAKEFEFVRVLLHQNHSYAFPGSLTTPKFNQCVTWILFTNCFHLSKRQLDAFRTLESKDHKTLITQNDRPLQPFNNRPIIETVCNGEVLFMDDDFDDEDDEEHQIPYVGNHQVKPYV